jgi:tetratricopeptide (TPR) repeat protein
MAARTPKDSQANRAGAGIRSSPLATGRTLAICVGLVALIWIVFGQTIRAGFINYDDNTYVYENPIVAAGLHIKGVVWAFSAFHATNWHPLTWISHMLDCQVFGLRPAGHHFTNVLLHTFTAVLLFLVWRQMTGAVWPSALVAALFAIHPLRVESVAWISERKDVLSGLFFVATLGAYTRYASRRSVGRYAWVILLCALGLMSKPMLVSLPMILLLVDYWPLGRLTNAKRLKPLVLEKTPLFVLALASCATTVLAQRATIVSIESLPLSWRLQNAVVSYAIYIIQLFWPVRLAPFYPHPDNQLAIWQVGLAIVLITGITMIAWVERRRRPYIFTGWFWYALMLLPVSGIIQIGSQAHADRYTYLPHIGLFVLIVWTLFELIAKSRLGRPIFNVTAVIAVVALTSVASLQVRHWHDSEKLWNHCLVVTKDNDIAHNGLGEIFFSRGEFEKAVAEFRIALSLRPNSPYAHNNLGLALTKTGKIDEAFEHLNTAVQILPTHPTAHYNLANVLLQKGQPDAAIKEFEQELMLDPEHVAARCDFASALLEKGDVNDATAQYKKAIEIRPDYAAAHYNLGNCYLEAGQTEPAIAEYERAIEFSPRLAEAHNNLAIILFQKGDLNRAMSEWEEVIRNQSGNIDALNNLSWVLATSADASVRDPGKALQFAQRLWQLPGPITPRILRTIAAAYAANGRFQEAIDTAQEGAQLARMQARNDMAKALEEDLRTYQSHSAINDSIR